MEWQAKLLKERGAMIGYAVDRLNTAILKLIALEDEAAFITANKEAISADLREEYDPRESFYFDVMKRKGDGSGQITAEQARLAGNFMSSAEASAHFAEQRAEAARRSLESLTVMIDAVEWAERLAKQKRAEVSALAEYIEEYHAQKAESEKAAAQLTPEALLARIQELESNTKKKGGKE